VGNTERDEQLRKIRQEKLEEAKQKLRDTIFGEASVRNLVMGMFAIFIDVILIAFAYGILLGRWAVPQGAQLVVTDPQGFLSIMLLVWIAILAFGILGGLEIGRYVQTEFTKRRRQRQPPPPPT
jgi:hypothetical protein